MFLQNQASLNIMEILKKYFPGLSEMQKKQFSMLHDLYLDWNSKINVISRKDMDNFFIHHVLHSLTIGYFFQFSKGVKILDVGTGGGFPGIPLAILFPECNFVLVDSIGKKIKVVNAVTDEIGLKNVRAIHARAEEIKEKFDFVVSRAVAELPKFYNWVKDKINTKQLNEFPNGIIYLKGGNIQEELDALGKEHNVINISKVFAEDFFETKLIVHIY